LVFQKFKTKKMEKFLYLFRGGTDPSLSPEAMQSHMQKWLIWMESLGKNGRFVAGEPLTKTGKQVNGKKKTITDGPFIEAKEMVGGFVIVNATDIEEAVEISKGCPIFEMDGKLEVRPIQQRSV
jgi:hypothetical protein